MITREEDGEAVDSHITVCIPNIPQHQGVADFGVYSIAYAYRAAGGDNLEEIKFEQEKMQEHLARCFSRQKLTPIPMLASHIHSILTEIENDIFCNCEMPT